MPSKITLKLINDERKSRRILSAKACGANYIDIENCAHIFAADDCYARDFEACVQASDFCKYIDNASCHGPNSVDNCQYDYIADCSGYDICNIDRITCNIDT